MTRGWSYFWFNLVLFWFLKLQSWTQNLINLVWSKLKWLPFVFWWKVKTVNSLLKCTLLFNFWGLDDLLLIFCLIFLVQVGYVRDCWTLRKFIPFCTSWSWFCVLSWLFIISWFIFTIHQILIFRGVMCRFEKLRFENLAVFNLWEVF